MTQQEQLLDASLSILATAWEIAAKREDMQSMLAVGDRFLLLYESTLSEEKPKPFTMGFGMREEQNDSNS